MRPPRLPLKFIGLWAANIAVLLVLAFATGLQDLLMNMNLRNLVYLYLGAGAVLAVLEQGLWDKLRGNT